MRRHNTISHKLNAFHVAVQKQLQTEYVCREGEKGREKATERGVRVFPIGFFRRCDDTRRRSSARLNFAVSRFM